MTWTAEYRASQITALDNLADSFEAAAQAYPHPRHSAMAAQCRRDAADLRAGADPVDLELEAE